MPRGCSIQLEKQAQDYILENIRDEVNTKRNLISKLYDLIEVKHELKVREFFEGYHVTPQDVYSKKVTVVGLAAQAGLLKGYQVDTERERLFASALGRLSFVNSRRWIGFMQKILPLILLGEGSLLHSLITMERTMLTMVHYTLWGKGLGDLGKRFASIEEAIYWVINDSRLYQELLDLLDYQFDIDFVDKPLVGFEDEYPLDLYCAYTMYQDYSINEELFHWQSKVERRRNR